MSRHAAPKPQAITHFEIERRVNELWGYVRNNRDNADSGTVCTTLTAIIDAAVVDMRARAIAAETALAEAKRKIRRLTQDVKESRHERIQVPPTT